MFKIIERLFGGGKDEEIAELIGKGAVIIDVRTPFEYNRGHAPGSVNIPLDAIEKYLKKIKKNNQPVITCCRSGARSGVAASTLKANGVDAFNGGSWQNVQRSAGLRKRI